MSDHMPRREINSIDPPHSLKSNFKFPRRPRPPTDISDTNEHTPLNLARSSLQRRESKSGLRSIFTRMKTVSDLNYGLAVVEEPAHQILPKGYSPNHGYDFRTTGRESMEKPFMTATRSKSTTKQALRSSPKSSPKTASKPARRDSATWDPPPLFQAYPQAIKHAQLSASTLSADSILRISNHKRNSSLRDDIAHASLGADEPNGATAKKNEKSRSRHRRQISGSISKADWTQKIYILVTSGYLLQYAGEGSFDRLPEKMMQLGKDSVAFACDVIPGKHWVLQISQAMDAKGIPAPDSRSLLSRLAFRGADYRRATTSFLLVLDSAEELESWITTVRREIEALGGQKYTSETGRPRPYDRIMQLDAQPSHRYIMQGYLHKSSNRADPRMGQFSDQGQNPRNSATESSSQSIMESSRERLSTGASLESQDLQQLDSLRENSFRLSYASSGQPTLLTSRDSSPACSPTHDIFGSSDKLKPSNAEGARPPSDATVTGERRRSIQTMQIPANEYHAMSKQLCPRPHSTFSPPANLSSQLQHSSRKPPPNFSMPHIASKQHPAKSPNSVPLTLSIKPNTHGGQEVITRMGRKAPTAPSSNQQLSPVKDQPSPIPQLFLYTPSSPPFPESSLVIENPPGFQYFPSRPLSPPHLNPRRQMKSPDLLQNEHDVPRYHSAFQMHSDVDTANYSPPFRSASPRAMPSSPNQKIRQTIPSHFVPDHPRATTIPRRLTSMQFDMGSSPDVESHARPHFANATRHSDNDFSNQAMNSAFHTPIPAKSSTTPPATLKLDLPSRHVRAESKSKALGNRRSMPLLVEGPPPAPPPNCALPPLPVSGEARSQETSIKTK